jgi:hypothetical protein
MKNIKIKPHTFYKRQPLSTDTELSMLLGDAWNLDERSIGEAVSIAKLQYNQNNRSFYAAQTTVPFRNVSFGSGVLNSIDLLFNVSSTTADVNATPAVKIYDIKDNYSLTEGDGIVQYDATGATVITSTIDYDRPLMMENFDGINKGFGEDVDTIGVGTVITLFLANKTMGAGSMKNENYFIKGYQIRNAMQSAYGASKYYYGRIKMENDDNSYYKIKPYDNGKTGMEDKWRIDANILTGNDPEYTLTKWIKHGAQQSYSEDEADFTQTWRPKQLRATLGMTKEEYVATYVDRVSQFNSIFNSVVASPEVHDIKVQSLETSGDTDRTFTDSRMSLSTDDVATDGAAASLYTFWENYSGATANNLANFSTANIFGSSSANSMYQQVWGHIGSIPYPQQLDANRAINYGGFSDSDGTFSAEIEIIFKVKKMASTARSSDGSYPISLVRSFTIAAGTNKPEFNQSFWDWVTQDGAHDALGDWQLSTINSNQLSDTFRMFDLRKFVAEGGSIGYAAGTSLPSLTAIPGLTDSAGNPIAIDLPMGEWITMRIKFRTGRNGTTGTADNGFQVYFPGLTDSNGQVKYFGADMSSSYWPGDRASRWPNHLGIGVTNYRSINFDGAVNNINKGFSADIEGADTDRETQVLIDRITFRNFTHNIQQNASLNMINPPRARSPITIPKPYYNVPSSGNLDIAGISYKQTNDNYFARKSEPAPFTISLGYDDDGTEGTTTYLLSSSTGAKQHASLQFHNFTALEPQKVQPIPSSYVKVGWSRIDDFKGHGMISDKCLVPNMFGASGASFWASGSYSGVEGLIDNFTQKGFIHISGNNRPTDNYLKDWGYSENPWAQTRILAFQGNTISVSNDEMFLDPPETTRYVVYQYGEDRTRGITGSGTVGFATPLHMTEFNDGTITLDRGIAVDDLGNELAIAGNNKVPRLMISAYKKWIWFYGYNLNQAKGTSPSYADWSWNPYFSGTSNAPRSYGSISTISSSTGDSDFYSDATVGTTYNEFLYNDARGYANQWSLSVGDEAGALSIMDDMGFGTYTSPTEEESEVLGGYMGKDVLGIGDNYINVSGYINAKSPEEGDEFNFAMVPAPYGTSGDYGWLVNLNTRLAGNPPYAIFGYKDELPSVENLEVSPSVDLLNANNPAQLAKGSATDVKLTWQESGEDVWYRTLYIDTQNIANKYHKSTFWAPLNESGATHSYYTTPEGSAVNFTYSGGATEVPGNIAGFQGWGAKFGGGLGGATLSSSASLLIASGATFAFMGHCVPNSVGTNGYVCSVVRPDESPFDREKEAFAVRWNANNSVGYTISTSAGLVSGSSTTQYDNDGIQPLSIVVTYDGNRQKNNAQLYINSVLEDTQSVAGTAIISGNVGIGGLPNVDVGYRWGGFLEEIVMTTGSVYVPTNNKNYLLDTTSLADLDSSYDSNAYQARMFVYDYTNIRGKTPTLVAESNTASWRVTGL